jgi:hypothetical protein
MRAEWRQKALANTLTTEEMRQWIELVRGARRSAAATSLKARAKKAPVDTASMLDEIDNL